MFLLSFSVQGGWHKVLLMFERCILFFRNLPMYFINTPFSKNFQRPVTYRHPFSENTIFNKHIIEMISFFSSLVPFITIFYIRNIYTYALRCLEIYFNFHRMLDLISYNGPWNRDFNDHQNQAQFSKNLQKQIWEIKTWPEI